MKTCNKTERRKKERKITAENSEDVIPETQDQAQEKKEVTVTRLLFQIDCCS